ncbi:hypothetical protein [Microbacterium sp. Bi128]|uniref:DUF6924 domain-containing protein n=1 Tax=Microbacterium sp. Bi128 TaxID=2821115 RepID=UPI0035ABA824
MDALSEHEDGFRAWVKAVDDTAWDRVGWEHVRQAAPAGNEHASVLFVVEGAALESGIRYRSRICATHRADRSDALRANSGESITP